MGLVYVVGFAFDRYVLCATPFIGSQIVRR